MTREIKFRAWWNGTMFYKHSVTIQIDGTVIFLDTDGKWTADSKEHPFITIMQYTGLKDKNGKEIYEGDILAVKFHPHYVERISWKGKPDAIAEVFWDFTGLRLKAVGEEDSRYADFYDFMDLRNYGYDIHNMNTEETEVIGNIYEHPHLLNSDQNVQECDTTDVQ